MTVTSNSLLVGVLVQGALFWKKDGTLEYLGSSFMNRHHTGLSTYEFLTSLEVI